VPWTKIVQVRPEIHTRKYIVNSMDSVWEQQADEYFDVGQEAKEGGGEGEGEGGDGEAAAPESGEGDAASSPKGKERAGMDLVED
jgi:hypothetical protein